jgi:hypothetical protein
MKVTMKVMMNEPRDKYWHHSRHMYTTNRVNVSGLACMYSIVPNLIDGMQNQPQIHALHLSKRQRQDSTQTPSDTLTQIYTSCLFHYGFIPSRPHDSNINLVKWRPAGFPWREAALARNKRPGTQRRQRLRRRWWMRLLLGLWGPRLSP